MPCMTEPQPPYGDKPYGSENQPYGSYQPPPAQNPYASYPPPPPSYAGAPGPINPYPQPGAPYGTDGFGQPLSDKSKIVAGLLQIFLSPFGVGRFYLGHTGIAIAQCAVSLLTCYTVGWIWPLVDGIMILMGNVKDAQGRTLRE